MRDSMDTTQLSIIVGTASAALTGLLTFISTKGVDAWLKVRRDAREATEHIATKEDHTLRFIIERQDSQIKELQVELHNMRKDHSDCEKKHEALKVRLEMVEQRITLQEKQVQQS